MKKNSGRREWQIYGGRKIERILFQRKMEKYFSFSGKRKKVGFLMRHGKKTVTGQK